MNKIYPSCCLSMNCGEIYCKGCPNEQDLIAYYGKEKHESSQFCAAFTLAREVNNAYENGDYRFDPYYQHLAGRFISYYSCGHREINREKDHFYDHLCADCHSQRPAH